MKVEFTAGVDDADRRLETVLRRLCPEQSLGSLHKALRKGDIRLNGAKSTADARVAPGDTVAIWDALLGSAPRSQPREGPAIPDDWVVYETSDLLVLNKPSGLLVHAGDGPNVGELPLDARVRARLSSATDASLAFRPGPLHRLDRETSGLVVFSKSLRGARAFSQAIAERRVKKTYLAVVQGDLRHPTETRASVTRDEASRTSRIDEDGAAAFSRFQPLAWAPGLSLVEVDLGTGRTHQIRLHAQSIQHPLAGDLKYGGGQTPAGLDSPWLLHAWKLSCDLLPALVAPLPPVWSLWIEKTFKVSP